jgi:RHS repeat-associated protein
MVALNENFASDRKARIEQAESAQSEKSVDHPSSAYLHRLRGENLFLIIDQCPLFIGRNADAYGNTLAFTGPGADGIWFTDDDVQSGYGANEIIYCGYHYDPETELYYVRNRTYSPVLGRWIQRDPIGYAGGINLYEYVSGRSAIALDANGTTSSNQHQCCQKREGNCCGADITDQLITMARQIQMVWNILPHFLKKVLARWTVIPPFAINAWGIHGMAIGGTPLTQAGTGKCVGTVTVAGNCYQEGTVNYWLAGLIYRALDSSWEFAPYAKLFEYEVAVYPIIPGLASGSPIVQKWYWWAAGTVGNPTAVPPPRKFRDCVPNAVQNKLPLSWYWGFLSGQS